jgi:hypothetical protein
MTNFSSFVMPAAFADPAVIVAMKTLPGMLLVKPPRTFRDQPSRNAELARR